MPERAGWEAWRPGVLALLRAPSVTFLTQAVQEHCRHPHTLKSLARITGPGWHVLVQRQHRFSGFYSVVQASFELPV